MRIFYSWLLFLTATFLWFMPITQGVYDFRTDVKTDSFPLATGIGVTTSSRILQKAIYDNDTGTIEILSSISEEPTWTSYNSTTRSLALATLSDNSTRTLSISYDVDSLSGEMALSYVLDIVPYLYYLLIIAFTASSIAMVLMGRAE